MSVAPESAQASSSSFTKRKTVSGEDWSCDLAKSPRDDDVDDDDDGIRWEVAATLRAE